MINILSYLSFANTCAISDIYATYPGSQDDHLKIMYPISLPTNRYGSFLEYATHWLVAPEIWIAFYSRFRPLYRLLYSTGVRIGEAISLRNQDIDFEHQYIIIRKTKNQQQRLVPLNSSMLPIMLQYKEARDNLPLQNIVNPNGYFFISPSGHRLSNGTVYRWFRVILKKCGIPHIGKNHGPRVHDVRHTAAVHSLMKQVKSGADIYCVLPIISVFLGHKTIKGTEKYVRLTQEMFPEIIKLEQSLTSFVFPSQRIIEINYEK